MTAISEVAEIEVVRELQMCLGDPPESELLPVLALSILATQPFFAASEVEPIVQRIAESMARAGNSTAGERLLEACASGFARIGAVAAAADAAEAMTDLRWNCQCGGSITSAGMEIGAISANRTHVSCSQPACLPGHSDVRRSMVRHDEVLWVPGHIPQEAAGAAGGEPGRGFFMDVQIGNPTEIAPFDYKWPGGDVEHFDRGWEVEGATNGRQFKVRHGIGKRGRLFGAPRAHSLPG